MELFFDMLRSIVYGVIEGITEWLPISSTGHMILAEQVLKFQLQRRIYGDVPRRHSAGRDPGRCGHVFQKAVALLR